MREKIQHILFQDNDTLFRYRDMFYHGDWWRKREIPASALANMPVSSLTHILMVCPMESGDNIRTSKRYT